MHYTPKYRTQVQKTLNGEFLPQENSSNLTTVTPDMHLSEINLNWTEEQLPESTRTKHVHRLHPYMGKFVPQLVEIFLRKFRPKTICDPFCGSGTTLVEANALGIPAVGADISEFNCLLSKVKTDHYDLFKLKHELKEVLARTTLSIKTAKKKPETTSEYLKQWFNPNALNELLTYKSLIQDYQYSDVMKIVLSRSARSSRLTTHFDLDFPKKPQTMPYYCYKHRRTCKPTTNALDFLSRYTEDTTKRIKEFSRIQTEAPVEIIHGDSRLVKFPKIDAVITSPPYAGLIDYHDQHRYAFELLQLDSNEKFEIGPAKNGKSKRALEEYTKDITAVFLNIHSALSDDGIIVVVVHDKQEIYENIAKKAGYCVEERVVRNVNRRTGRRSKDFFEEVYVWRPEND